MFVKLGIIAFAVVVVIAEPPEFYSRQLQNVGATPYHSSQWKPSAEFRPPQPHTIYGPPPQKQGPVQEYGPPSQKYKVPSQEYGPPQKYGPLQEGSTTTEPEFTTTEFSTTEIINTDIEDLRSEDTETHSEKLSNEEKGVYYIYHPSRLLQKVIYSTNDDKENMVFSAKLKYENVEPIKGPIFTYDPETYKFKKV
ncbi:hypothetical protein NQ314_015639 [Rhamnusium bicolor]|uniref:Uncharacterized protein n=1 Tax=Rhamnusium bicolor TaxID=1586634 RepID=A0AAV8WY64_9CUCU|nr:hypothetical protein NQ314_015639 [Rhamnusium bicolor]